jgi:MoaA/NifB/PqqE/SkfB family radical SAM enzyme
MIHMQRFSVYNQLIPQAKASDNPLHDLLPDDYDHGWSVARNLLKPLNHLDFLKQKEEIAVELNLHNTLTPSDTFDLNYAMLAQHQARTISTTEMIRHLVIQLQQNSGTVSEEEIHNKLREYATIRHMEFHPSDVCNLTCCGCTYGHDDPERKPPPINFPFEEIRKISQLRPKSMVIIGGGEPTLYRSGKYYFQDVIDEVCTTNPGIALALVTNGTYRPKGDWPNRLSWMRLSLDAATEDIYRNFRGKPMFEKVVRNFLDYLDYDVNYVGLGFLFARSNIHEYATFARFIYALVQKEKPHALHKVNIQYRPLRRDPYQYKKQFVQAVTREQVERAVGEVRALADSSEEMKAFLKHQTNITAILGGNTHPPHQFSRCYYSQTFRIVRANGDLRPCFIRVTEPDFILGNIHTDNLETIALNSIYVAAIRKPHCDAHGCRQCHVNYTFEQGLKGDLKPSTSQEVLSDPMY